ncbi:type 1 glutamine amidotransferase [Anaerolineales bacterium HSG6]|nr:type 1 glutamine amidotransferase [Anaerolineales bacterium HSG6]
MTLKLLLLQARDPDDTAKVEERISFAQKMGLQIDQLTPYDMLQKAPIWPEVQGYDALLIGGSGDYYVSKGNLPHVDASMDFLRTVVSHGKPMFASCFGFQLLVQALGGEVIYDPDNMEVGTYVLNLAPAGETDDLLSALPHQFKAQLGHKDRASRLPIEAIHLAGSERCPFQALRIKGKPIWATQFHPELSGAENRARFEQYRAGYGSVMSEAEQQKTLDGFQDSPEATDLLRRFVELVFG